MFKRMLFGLILSMLLLLSPPAWPAVLEGGPFIIEYADDDRSTAEQTLAVLTAAVAEFAPILPVGEGKIHVVLPGSLSDFAQRAGGLSKLNISGFARPGAGLMVVKPPHLRLTGEDFAGTLRHELLHILLHRNTDTHRLPRWLNEGICMSWANEFYWQSMYTVSRMFVAGGVLGLDQLDAAFTTPGDEREFGDAYAQALSMTRYLRNHLGDKDFWDIVLATREKAFSDALYERSGVTLQELYAGYTRSLWVAALISALASGSLLGPAGFLTIIAWWRIRGRNKRRLAQMAVEERAYEDTPDLFEWDDVTEDPDAWKQGTEYASDDDDRGRL